MDIILGTAGHIDHGKTSLVASLTGIDCDRLEEEKRRGITIELGFAWMDLPDGRRLGIVDVPGHERFVKNMVAGASGVDCVMLVIAADEGVMPQTKEHLEICSLLGIRSGLVALTKTDLVDDEWLDFVTSDIREALGGTFLAHAPIVPVSSSTGAGLENLRKEITKLVYSLPATAKSDILRLPVDRVFSVKGFGTVVTGTIISGSCAQGEKLCLEPSGRLARARNLQVHNVPVQKAHAGQRCAVNLQGLDVTEIERGDIVARPDTLFPANSWFIRLNCLKSSPLPIRQRMEVHFHHGSKECPARIIFRDRNQLEPGQSAIAEVKFTQPMAAVYGDHCVLRAHSPLRAIGGGTVINPLPLGLKKRDSDYSQKMALLEELGACQIDNPDHLAPKSPRKLVTIAFSLCRAPGTDFRHLQVLSGLDRPTLNATLTELEQEGAIVCWDKANDCWISRKSLYDCMEKCRLTAENLHEKEPLKTSFAPGALVAGWGEGLPQKFIQELLDLAVREGILAMEGPGLKLAAHKTSIDGEDAKILDTLAEKIGDGGATPPFIKELIEEYGEENGWNIKRLNPLLNYLCDTGKLLKLQEGVYYDKEEFAKIKNKILAWFAEHDELEVGNMKTILGVSRKYAIPILEYLDAVRLTFRVGNKRHLRK